MQWAGAQRGLLAAIACLSLGACPGSASDGPPDKGAPDRGVAFADLSTGDDGSARDGSARDGLADATAEAPSGCAATCSGCCTPSGTCEPGTADNSCGKSGSPCADCTLVSGQCGQQYCLGCTASCTDKLCGAGDGCGGTCAAGSGCCTPSCAGKLCGAKNGCGGTCTAGSGCCTPSCSGKLCGAKNGCGGTCTAGSGCCTPSCSGKLCGAGNGCGGTCQSGSGCCAPSCSGKACGAGDGCGGTCSNGSCPTNEKCQSNSCVCKSASYKRVGGVCKPSCGTVLNDKGLSDNSQGCCSSGCAGTVGGGPGSTWDCNWCCEGPPGCI